MHGVHYNLAPGGLMYSPARDFAYNYPQLIKCIIDSFNADYWPQLTEVVGKAMDTSDDCAFDELCKAKEAYCQYINICCEDPTETVKDVLRRAGWFEIDDAAQAGWMAMMGYVMTGQLFGGLRDVTPEDQRARPEAEAMLEYGREARRVLNRVSKGDELKSDFRELMRRMREDGDSWENIEALVILQKTFGCK